MRRRDVIFNLKAAMHGGDEHACVLARTVVVQLIEGQAVALKLARSLCVIRRMRAAAQVRFIQADARQHICGSLRVNRLAFV